MTILEAALKYAELGLSVLPIGRNKKACIKWERYQKTPATPDEIRQWWKQWPDANIGIATGHLSGIFSLDFDSPDAKAIWEERFEQMPPGLWYTTGRGSQYWFSFPSYGLGNKSAVMQNVDIRGEGGYTIVPPSVHANGKVYSWGNISALEYGLDELSEMPAEMLKYCKDARNTTSAPGTAPMEWTTKKDSTVIKDREGTSVDWYNDLLLHGAEKGSRNASATKLVGRMVYLYAKDGMGKEEMLEPLVNSMLTWNERNKPPLAEKEIRTVCNSIINKHSFDNLSDAVGSPIFMIERVEKKIGNIQYVIYTSADKTISMSGAELANPNLFSVKLMDLTKVLIAPPKKAVWAQLITACLADCIERVETIEESAISILAKWIADAADRNGDEKTKLYTEPIILNGIVHITNQAANNYVKINFTKGAEWDDAKKMLKTLGFEWNAKQSPLRIGKDQVKTWRIPLAQLHSTMQRQAEDGSKNATIDNE